MSANVALHPEGVDRNSSQTIALLTMTPVALHPEGVDRNQIDGDADNDLYWSPSTRRAWIEIIIG